MSYKPLQLRAEDDRVNAALSMFTERYLEQAHYLLCHVYGRNSADQHFGQSALVMTVLAIASASVVRYFDPVKGENSNGDRAAFEECVLSFFPWKDVGIIDDQHRGAEERYIAASKALYKALRCPTVHTAGVVGLGYPVIKIHHVFPGLSGAENQKQVCELCERLSLDGQPVLELLAEELHVHTRELYWAARKMIENMSEDERVASDIIARLAK